MNIILDLDETLVSVTTKPVRVFDFKFSIIDQLTNQPVTYYARKRPNLEIFLKYIFKNFSSVAVWTAATKQYASKVIQGIMTNEQINALAFVKCRDDLKVDATGTYTKPLHRVFQTHPVIKKHNTLMIDDRRSVLVENLGNAIIVPAWKGHPSDDPSLAQLIIILNGILQYRDVIDFQSHKEVIFLKDLV
jgi:TFIIF-interacting CTD phosphatase-like protein